MFSSKKIFFSKQPEYPIIIDQNPYGLPTNNEYVLDSFIDLKLDQGNDVDLFCGRSGESNGYTIIGIPSKEQAIILYQGFKSMVIDAPLKNNDGSTTNFGKSVSINGNLALIGAPNYKGNGNDSGYVYVYYKYFDGIWRPLGSFCSEVGGDNSLPIIDRSSKGAIEGSNFGLKVSVESGNSLPSGDKIVILWLSSPGFIQSSVFNVVYKNLLPCEIGLLQKNSNEYPYESNSKYAHGSLNIYSEPNHGSSDWTLSGKVTFVRTAAGYGFVNQSGSGTPRYYGRGPYNQFGYSIDVSDYISIGAPGTHPVIPSKGYVDIINHRDSNYTRVRIEGLEDNDGFGKAVCSLRDFNPNAGEADNSYNITASNNYIIFHQLYYEPSYETAGGIIPASIDYSRGPILNLGQEVELLKLHCQAATGWDTRGGLDRAPGFEAILSVNGKIYYAYYKLPSIALQPVNTGYRPGVPF